MGVVYGAISQRVAACLDARQPIPCHCAAAAHHPSGLWPEFHKGRLKWPRRSADGGVSRVSC